MKDLKNLVKSGLKGVFLGLAFLPALFSAFGRIETIFLLFAHACAFAPGIVGDYLRIAYYRLTLDGCAPDSRIEFGSFFAHAQAKLGHSVYIGEYCVLGRTDIGDRTQIASAVQILSGRRQHTRDSEGRILGSDDGEFASVSIGADCWLGAGVIVMADVGAGSTVGAGSVVVKPIPPGSTAVGNPARVIRSAEAESAKP